MRFKYKWTDKHGNEVGLRRKQGRLADGILSLEKIEIPITSLQSVRARDRHLWMHAVTSKGATIDVSFKVWSVDPIRLKRQIDLARSGQDADRHREHLKHEDRIECYRESRCRHCEAIILLTDIPETPQVYCDYCEVLSTLVVTDETPQNEQDYAICDECRMFSRPTKFTSFYFYYLFVTYGVHHQPTWRCPGCMRPEAWRMLIANSIFLLGIPISVVQLLRSYGNSIRGGAFHGLDTANRLVRQGKINEAIDLYSRIVDRVPFCAGVKTNLARGLMKAERLDDARATLVSALEDCGNYGPALDGLLECEAQAARN